LFLNSAACILGTVEEPREFQEQLRATKAKSLEVEPALGRDEESLAITARLVDLLLQHFRVQAMTSHVVRS